MAVLAGTDGTVIDANRALLRMLDRIEADVAGCSALDFVHADDRQRAITAFHDLRTGRAHTVRIGLRVVRASGEQRWVQVAGAPVGHSAGEPEELVVHVLDVSVDHDAEERLRHLALHDDLTGLPNRVLFLDRLHQARATAQRRGAVVAVLFLDLDFFKQVNDALGHHAGDDLLRQVGARLAAAIRPSDTAARFGGDEFVVCCADLGHDRASAGSAALLVAERVVDAVRGHYRLDDDSVEVDVSGGIALALDPSEPAEALLRRADAAMYRAKESGRGRMELAPA